MIEEAAKTDALVALERAREQGLFDDEQIARLGPLVEWLRGYRTYDLTPRRVLEDRLRVAHVAHGQAEDELQEVRLERDELELLLEQHHRTSEVLEWGYPPCHICEGANHDEQMGRNPEASVPRTARRDSGT